MSPGPSARLALCAVLLLSSAVAAHNGEQRPMPAIVVGGTVKYLGAPRWNWLHWWEANRERYLTRPSQDPPGQAPDSDRMKALREESARALVDALSAARRDSLASESALALGRIRHAPAVGSLRALAARSPSPRARTGGILSLGLLGTPDAETQLVGLNPVTLDERSAVLVAVGLLPELRKPTVQRLRLAVQDPDAALAAVAVWALRQHAHAHEDEAAFYEKLLADNDHPLVASEALLTLGATGQDRSLVVARDVLLALDRGVAVSARTKLQAQHDAKVKQAQLGREIPILPGQPKPDVKRQRIEVGEELIQLAWLRTSAAIALGRLNNPEAGEALFRFVDAPATEDAYLLAPKGLAIMALAEYPSERTRDRFIALLGKTDRDGKMVLDAPRDSPLRGFAALALGLYARPYDTPQGPADRPGSDWALTTLAERLEDEREEPEVRTACALSLGLAQRTAVLPILHRVMTEGDFDLQQEQPIVGYLLLGRALAGDNSVPEAAGRFLATRDDPTMSGILARRAAVLALGMTRSPAAVPLLTKAWHLNHYVNREVIVALRLIGAANAAAPVIDRLRVTDDEEERAYMAQVIGELFEPRHPPALLSLTAGGNYTARNDRLLPLQKLSNGFLFEYLIPSSFGENW